MITGFQKKAISEDTAFGRMVGEVTEVLEGLTARPEDLLQRAIMDAMEYILDGLEQSRNDIESARRNMNGDLRRLDSRHEGASITTGNFPFTYSWASYLEQSVAKHEAGLAEFVRVYLIGQAAGFWGRR